MSTITSRVWRDGVAVLSDFPLADLDTHLADDGCVVWLDLCDPEAALLADLAAELGLDPQAVEDAVAPGERPKATHHGSHTFLTAYATHLGGDGAEDVASRLTTARISAFVMRGGLITVRRSDAFDVAALLRRWEADPDLLARGSDALVHGLLDLIVDGHFDAIQQLDDAMEHLEDDLFADDINPRHVQRQVYRVRKELVQLRRVVLPMREVVNGVIRHRLLLAQAHDDLAGPIRALDGYYQDLYDHVLRAAEWTESLRDMVSTVFETNLSLQDARLNTVMKKLAGWAAVIAVPTAITGWFGQNVPYPGYDTVWGVWLSLGMIVVLSAGLYGVLRRQDWI